MYTSDHQLYVANAAGKALNICGKMANRHGLVAGATGTGKTVTLQVLAETFCQAGVPCFMADMKGDLSGIAKEGRLSSYIEKVKDGFGIPDPVFAPCPVIFYDVFGEQGHPMRTTISNMGPQLLSRLMGLNETQSGVLEIVFRVADERGLLLIDIKDLRAMLNYVSAHAAELQTTYGNVSPASVGAIQRAILALESQGADKFFAEPAFDIFDLLRVQGGKGVMSVLAADKLMQQPKLYSSFLLWLLSELYSTLPEVGDMDLPKMVFFFDEAHTLFEDTSPALTAKIEQVVRLIRSKGVGIYFVTQNPTDIPDAILGQLGNRVQHALRAYTPKDQKAVRSAAETFRPNPAFKTAEVITTLGTGEALVSFLDEKGTPSMVEQAKILFPLSQIGALTEAERGEVLRRSPIAGRYDTMIDRHSAFEALLEDAEKAAAEQEEQQHQVEKQKEKTGGFGALFKKVAVTAGTAFLTSLASNAVSDMTKGKKGKSKSKTSAGQKALKSATTRATSTLVRGTLGNLLK